MHPHVNWLAVLVSGIVIFMLGGLWYSPVLFAKKWIALQNKTEEQMRAEAAAANMPLMYASAFITGLIIAWAMAMVMGHIANDMPMNAAHGTLIGAVLWLGFAATTSYATALFPAGRDCSGSSTALTTSSRFVLAGIILAVWR